MTVLPQHLQSKRAFVALPSPELTGSFEAALELPTSGLDCTTVIQETAVKHE